MSFSHAKKGVKKIYTGELLMLVATVLTTLSSIVTLVSGAGEGTSFGVADIGPIIFALVSGALAIVALVFSIIGVIQCSKDEDVFKGVIFVMLLSLAAEIVSAVFGSNQVVIKLSSVITSISGTITTVLVVIGIGKIAEKLGDEGVFTKGQTLLRVIIWIALLSVIVNAISAFVPFKVVAVIEIVMLIATGILEVVQTFLYLLFLHKSKKMLQAVEE